jgi:mannosyltransferase OCH1-like enzyme
MIHQIWFNFRNWGESTHPPIALADGPASWVQLNPDWTYRLWQEHTAHALLQEFPSWLEAFYAFPEPIQRVDFFRWVVLFVYGGCYCDIDSRALVPISTFMNTISKKNDEFLWIPSQFWVQNAVILASPRHPLIFQIIHNMAPHSLWSKFWQSRRSVIHVFSTTGPGYVSTMLARYPKDTSVVFSPRICVKHLAEIKNQVVLAQHAEAGTWGWNTSFAYDILRIVACLLVLFLLFFVVRSKLTSRPSRPLPSLSFSLS